MKGIQFEYVGKESVTTQAATIGSARATKGASAHTMSKTVGCGMNAKAKLEINVNTLIAHLIRWSREHQASITESVLGLPSSTVKYKRSLIHIGLRLCRATTRGSTGLGGLVF